MGLNFNGVESANSEVKESTFKIVKPGIQALTITGVEPTLAGTGTPGVVVTFESKEAEASFNERFWLSAGALPRVQYLVEKFTGAKLTEEFTQDGQELANAVASFLAARLVGKTQQQVIVDGEKRTKESNGKVYENIYPVLRFAGFVDPIGAAAEPIIKDNTASTPKVATTDLSDLDSKEDDLPF